MYIGDIAKTVIDHTRTAFLNTAVTSAASWMDGSSGTPRFTRHCFTCPIRSVSSPWLRRHRDMTSLSHSEVTGWSCSDVSRVHVCVCLQLPKQQGLTHDTRHRGLSTEKEQCAIKGLVLVRSGGSCVMHQHLALYSTCRAEAHMHKEPYSSSELDTPSQVMACNMASAQQWECHQHNNGNALFHGITAITAANCGCWLQCS